MQKRRITVTVDEEAYQAAVSAVAAGRASSVSAWVNEALTARREDDDARALLGDLLAEHQAEQGAFTPEELAEQERRDLEAAAAVRARRATRRRAG
ncbi:MAG: hypothetical protein GXY13_07455 [Acidimicrobiales bacterium]|nr:hypothetical protein [Acidimicrobiales bacterium]